ncbi:MAG: biotin/lipoyl-binding protein [Roseiflexaceae bacterium]|nr:biotin/lipoyl-binding protein [Roseiflexaceae bacterium]
MKRGRLITGVVTGLTAAALAACSAQPAAPAPTATAPVAAQPTVVAPTPVPLPTSQPIRLGITGIGEVKSAQDANLSFQVQGTVAQVFVKEGDVVKKGDLLAILDTRAFDQQLEQAKAALANALAQEAALTEAPRQVDLAAARAAVAQAQAALEALQRGPKEQDIRMAEAALAAAEANLQATRDRLSFAKT